MVVTRKRDPPQGKREKERVVEWFCVRAIYTLIIYRQTTDKKIRCQKSPLTLVPAKFFTFEENAEKFSGFLFP